MEIKGHLNVQTIDINGSVNVKGNITGFINEGAKAGSNNYEKLINKPSIENVQLDGNKSFKELGLNEISNMDIKEIANRIFFYRR